MTEFIAYEAWEHKRTGTGLFQNPCSWAEIHNETVGNGWTGSGPGLNYNTVIVTQMQTYNATLWWRLHRILLKFDTSALAETVGTAQIKVTAPIQFDSNWLDKQVCICGFTGPNGPDNADYAKFNGTLLSDDKYTVGDIAIKTTLTFNLNAAGLAAINTGGFSYFGLVFDNDRIDSEPSFSEYKLARLTIYSGHTAVPDADKPTLVITAATPTNDLRRLYRLRSGGALGRIQGSGRRVVINPITGNLAIVIKDRFLMDL